MNEQPAPVDAPLFRQTDKLVIMLGIISSQIEAALRETDAPAATLVEATHSIGKATQTIANCIFEFSGSPARVFEDLVVLHDELQDRTLKATAAIQFHDRLVQCLTHVCSNLTYIAEFIACSTGPKSAAEWDALRGRIRALHSMEQERALFELLNQGVSTDATQATIPRSDGATGTVELF